MLKVETGIIPNLFVGDRDLNNYISSFVLLSRKNSKIMLAARGRNTATAINLALWIKTNIPDFDIGQISLETTWRPAREDHNRQVAMSQINITMLRNGVHR